MKKTKRRLRPWVKNTFKAIATFVVVCSLAFGFLCLMTEAHYQRAQYWSEVGGF